MQGRPVKKRVKGFEADITTLSRIRTALKLDSRLNREKVSLAIQSIDSLTDILIELSDDIAAARKSA